MSANRDIVVVHTSDVHVDHEYAARQNNGDGAKPLAVVLAAAKALAADVLLLCGDTFDCHNIPVALVRRVSTMIRDSGVQTVLLPGNSCDYRSAILILGHFWTQVLVVGGWQ